VHRIRRQIDEPEVGVIMVEDKILRSRGKRLEESFFSKLNDQLVRELKEKKEKQAKKEALSEASGITDDAVLDKLIELDVNVERTAALTLVPLIEVAWADGVIQAKEREAILDAASSRGIARGSLPCKMLESWLVEPPELRLLEVWDEYMGAFAKTLSPEERETLKRDLMTRAREVAKAAGGFLGLASISKKEQDMLEELERAFG